MKNRLRFLITPAILIFFAMRIGYAVQDVSASIGTAPAASPSATAALQSPELQALLNDTTLAPTRKDAIRANPEAVLESLRMWQAALDGEILPDAPVKVPVTIDQILPGETIMWQEQAAKLKWQREGISYREFAATLPGNGTAASFDVLAGKKVDANGGLVAAFTSVNFVRGKPFEWTLTLTVPDGGGLVEFTGHHANEAPTEGYQATVNIHMAADAKSWAGSAVHIFYYKAPGGKYYGWIVAGLQTDIQPPLASFQVRAYINPSGMRNLQGGHPPPATPQAK